MQYTVILSDNGECKVQTLPLFALESIGPKDIGDFTYTIRTGLDETYTIVYTMPDTPPVIKDPNDIWQQVEFARYHAAISHNLKRLELADERRLNIGLHITNECVPSSDRHRVVTEQDYRLIYEVCIPREVTKETIAQELRDFFLG